MAVIYEARILPGLDSAIYREWLVNRVGMRVPD